MLLILTVCRFLAARLRAVARALKNGSGLLGQDRLVTTQQGRRLRAMVAGSGDDLVVLEAGLGVSGLYWGPVFARIARDARVLAYERAGIGASAPAVNEPRDLPHLAADLAAIVHAVPHRRLVLVGHSWGGPIVRTFAAGHLADGHSLNGLALVDPSDEHAADLYTSAAARWSDAVQNALLVPLARARLLAPLLRTQLPGLPPELVRAVLAASATVTAARTTVAENRTVAGSLRALAQHPPTLGATPLTVVSGQRHGRLDRQLRARLVAAHRQTVAEHPGARFVPAQRSGHLVPLTEPELVAREALALLRGPDEEREPRV